MKNYHSNLMKKFYLHDGHLQQGPFDIADLRSKGITSETYIWYQGLNQWIPAGQIEELKPLFLTIPPAFQSNTFPSTPLSFMADGLAEPERKKFKMKLFVIAGSILAFGLICWLTYINNCHVCVLENVH